MLASARSRRPMGVTILHIALAIALAFGSLAAAAGYWGVVVAPDLVRSPYDAAVIAASRTVERGRDPRPAGAVLARNERDENGELYRAYANQAVSQVVGYSSRRFGSAGLERAYSAELAGLAVDPLADALRKFGGDLYDPQDLHLSLSYDLQRAAIRALGDRKGAVVMLDPTTGEILALASTPTYDASAIADPSTAQETFEALQDDPDNPLLPRATLGRYVPGSVFKIVTAIAGLGSGAITPRQRSPSRPRRAMTGCSSTGSGSATAIRSARARRSRSVRRRRSPRTSTSRSWGSRPAGRTWPSSRSGSGSGRRLPFDLPTAASQVTNGRGDDPGGFVDDVELANAAYGQGETFVTPLQMALVASTVANDGVLMKPRLVTALEGKRGTREIEPRAARSRDLGRGRAGDPASDAAGGRGRPRQAVHERGEGPGIPTAGKSGTAELGGSGEPHSWFIGFAPVNQPKVAIAVVVERAGRGGAVASPIAGELMQAYFEEFGE